MLVSKSDCITISNLNFYYVGDIADEERPRRVLCWRLADEDMDVIRKQYKK